MPFRFLNFEIYQNAKKFYRNILDIILKFPKEEKYSLTDQLRRAGLSIILNIAEGCDRGTDKDFNRYLMNALGSLNEVVAGIDIAFENRYINKVVYSNLIDIAEKLSKQIGAFSKKLKTQY
jgi:four helix bundle protein